MMQIDGTPGLRVVCTNIDGDCQPFNNGRDSGRSLVATRNFDTGSVILREEPLASCQYLWNVACKYTACRQCMRPLENVESNIDRLSGGSASKVVLPRLESSHSTFTVGEPVPVVRCPLCSESYCSTACCSIANAKWHRLLCCPVGSDSHAQLSAILDLWKSVHYPPETFTVELVLRLISSVVQSDRPDQLKQTIESLVHSESEVCATTEHSGASISCEIRYELEDKIRLKIDEDADGWNGNNKHMSASEFESFLNRLREMIFVLFDILFKAQPELMRQYGTGISAVQSWLKSTANFRSLFVLLARNAQGVATSPFAHWRSAYEGECQKMAVNSADTTTKALDNLQLYDQSLIDGLYDSMDAHTGLEFLNSEGSALYAMHSMVNHSCEPNAQVQFQENNHILSLTALRPIKADEEIHISYLDECQLQRGRQRRRAELRDNYLFICHCSRCGADSDSDDDESSSPSASDTEEHQMSECD